MPSEITELKLRILTVIQEVGDPLLSHIANRLSMTQSLIRNPLMELVNDGYVRMKDDDIDHDWAYRLTRLGQQALAAEAFSS